MVTIAGINDDLDDYLKKRKGGGGWKLFGPRPSTPPSKPELASVQSAKSDSSKVVDEQPGFWKRMFGAQKDEMISEDLTPEEMARLEKMERRIETIDEAEREFPDAAPELEREKESLIERFFAMFRGYEREHQVERKMGDLEVYEAERAAKDEEVKKVLRIVHHWLEQLPPEAKEDFRASHDFLEYKAMLERYGLVKAKEPRGSSPVRNVPGK